VSYDVRLETLRSLDKFDRVGFDGIAGLLGGGRRDETGDFKFGVGLADASIEKLLAFLRVPNRERGESLTALRALMGENALARAGIDELAEIDAVLSALGVADAHAAFDMTIVRGLAYYTGPVFEAVLLDAPEFGSVFSGGRYDGLVQRFQSAEIPAVGASVGVDRLLVALQHLQLVERRSSPTEVLITVMDPSQRNQYLAMAAELRRAGIATEVFLGGRNFGKQLKYADKLGIPIALIAGGDEFARGEVALKDLWAGREVSKQLASFEEWRENPTQITVARGRLVEEVRTMRERQRHFEQKLRGAQG
jgi:histidyl-tRNA synthetase